MPDPGDAVGPEVIGVDVWMDADQMSVYDNLGFGVTVWARHSPPAGHVHMAQRRRRGIDW